MKKINQILSIFVLIVCVMLSSSTWAACPETINELGQRVQTCGNFIKIYNSQNQQISQEEIGYKNGQPYVVSYEYNTYDDTDGVTLIGKVTGRVYENDTSVKNTFTYSYTENGVETSTTQEFKDSYGKTTGFNSQNYNAQGNTTHYESVEYEDGKPSYTSHVWDYTYAADGKTLTGQSKINTSTNGTVTSRIETYTEDGKNKTGYTYGVTYEDDSGYTQTTEYEADGSTIKKYAYESLDVGGIFKESYLANYSYDEYDQRIYDETYYDEDGHIIANAEYRNTYDAEGNLIGDSYIKTDLNGTELYRNGYYEDDSIENGAYYLYEEYENGMLSYRESYINENGESTYDTYEYFENGMITERDFNYWDENDRHDVYQYYTYDENGNLIEESEEVWGNDENGDWVMRSSKGKMYEHHDDGSVTVYDQDGKFIGFKNKRIYTIEEATKLSKPTGNKFTLRYK